MSASHKPAPPNDFLWSDAEVARAKQLRREGGTHPAVAAALRAEFGTQRTTHAVQKLFARLRRPDEMRAENAAHKAAARLSTRAQAQVGRVVVAKTVQRHCLRCRGGFESHGPGNRLCEECKRLGVFGS
jgi:tRNA(Ile2) C34 agmatinyltransferase TiaS